MTPQLKNSIGDGWNRATEGGRKLALRLGKVSGDITPYLSLEWKDLPRNIQMMIAGRQAKNKFDTAREKAAYMAGLSAGGRSLGGALDTLRRKKATRLERTMKRGLGRNPSAEETEIMDAYVERGKEVITGKGGFYIKGRGFVSLRQARKETGINMATKRKPSMRVSPWGDYATIAMLSGARKRNSGGRPLTADQLRDGISEGEQRLRSKVDSLGKRLTPGQLSAVQRSIDYAKREMAKLGRNPELALTESDVAAGRIYYAKQIDTDAGTILFHGPKTKAEAKKAARHFNKIGHQGSVVKAPAWLISSRGKNPDALSKAKDLFRRFHGKSPKEVLELQTVDTERGTYTSLGDLVQLTVESPAGKQFTLQFEGDGVKLASSPAGTQLYIIGGKQALNGNLKSLGLDETKDLVDLGDALQINYLARKVHTKFQPIEWVHDFGEETGEYPRAFYNKLQERIFLAGGRYKVELPKDGSVSPGIVN
jgi:hypothetical protein